MADTAFNHDAGFVSFFLADCLIGMDILAIREIVPAARITRVQHAPEAVRGVMNLRGQILAVLDMGILLGLGQTRIGADTHIIVFKHRDVGFLVDRIGDVFQADENRSEPVPANVDPAIKPYIDQIIRYQSQVVMALSADRILAYSPGTADRTEGGA